MTHAPQHIRGQTVHARRGAIRNTFRYGVDYVLIDPEARSGPALFSRNRWNLAAVHDRDHGGARDNGRGADWAREVLAARGLRDVRLLLLTQPSFMGYIFNPVSFWLAYRGDDLLAVIAEVNNTFGDRHSYICAMPGFAPIQPNDRPEARKVFHVSPFQEVEGDYTFGFSIQRSRISVLIAYRNGTEGVFATLTGERAPMTNISLIGAAIRRPTGAFRTVALIYWQALKLKLKGARYASRPLPPPEEVT